ncbi:MAG: DUF6273 domain-containing protein [Eubacteriaceae bacterium]
MEELKCVSCSGKVDINEELMIGVCEYCGTEQPLPEEIIQSIEKKKKEQQAQAAAERRDKIKKKIKKIMKIIIPSLAVLIAFIIIFSKVILPSVKYNNAMNYYNDKNYIKAAVLFTELEGYKDSSSMNKESNYLQAEMYFNAKNYTDAIPLFDKLGTYKDSSSIVTESKYQLAAQYLNEKDYDEAIALFSELGNYKDSVTFIKESKYQQANNYIYDKKYREASNIYLELGNYKDSEKLFKKYNLFDLKKGEIIYYGNYEQDNNTANGKEAIQWLVLSVEKNKALLISYMCIDCKKYNENNTSVTWETCTLRKWLNTDFLNNAFTIDEQKKIITTTLKNVNNPVYEGIGGKDTKDKIFFLGIYDFKYITSPNYILAESTAYAISKGANVNYKTNKSWWWLRSPGKDNKKAAGVYVGRQGSIEHFGYDIIDSEGTVRPVFWLKLD